MRYPSRNEIVACVENPILIRDAFLKNGVLSSRANGATKFWSGGFSIVFQVNLTDGPWAFRVWHTPVELMKSRYAQIQDHLSKCELPYFTEFSYIENGLFTGEVTVDTSRMRWVDGMTLDEYITENLSNREALLNVADKFLQMVTSFHADGISHGDLQHGNIIVGRDGNLKVIDYDSMFVPGLESFPDQINGQAGYQHPARCSNQFSCISLDYFSELVIYLSLMVYADRPELWNENTDWMLFSKDDFEDPENSSLILELRSSSNKMIIKLTEALMEFLSKSNIESLIPLEDVVFCRINTKLPKLKGITDIF